MADARRFEPTPAPGVWVQYGLGVLVIVAGVPLMVWWRDLEASVALQLAMMSAPLLAWSLKVWFGVRHRGTLVVDDTGLEVKTAAGTNAVAWSAIHRVHRFGDRLVIETTPPHRRITLLLDGHEEHLPAIVETMRSRAPSTDLRWMNVLGQLLD